MIKTADITLNNQTLHLSGDLDFYNVMSVYRKSLDLLKALPAYQIDFSNLRSSDSAGIALIMEWVKLAKRQQKSIQLNQLPTSLQSIAKVSGLEGLV
jgi:phospholipid transport system transporter-binding protein